jgi:Tol biopolymer transport system component
MTTRLLVHRSDGLWVVDDGWKSLCRTSIIGFCLSRDGSRVAVLTPLGVLTGIDLIDVETGRRREIGRLRGRVLDPQWHPGGKRLGAISQSDDGDSKIVVLDVDTGQTTTLPSFPERYNLGQLEWSPDGQMLAVEGQPLDHLRGMSVFLVTPNSDSPRLIAPAGSPDRRLRAGDFRRMVGRLRTVRSGSRPSRGVVRGGFVPGATTTRAGRSMAANSL